MNIKRNRVVIAALAMMIAVAGYLNLSASRQMMPQSQKETAGKNTVKEASLTEDSSAKEAINELDDLTEASVQSDSYINVDVPAEEDTMIAGEHIGEAVLTGTQSQQTFAASARLSREQLHSKNKESLLAIVDNQNVDEAMRQEAVNDLMTLTKRAEKETTTESLLAAKGFENAVVTLNDHGADVVICANEITDRQRAQIEDIVTRNAEVDITNVVITTLNN